MTWQPTSLFRGDALAFCARGSWLFAALYDDQNSTVYRSGDEGQTWEPSGRGLPPDVPVSALLTGPDGLVAGTLGQGVFHSRDDGRSWQAIRSDLPGSACVTALVWQGDLLFASTLRSGIFRSADGGATWASVGRGLPMDGQRLGVYALTSDPLAVYVSHALGIHRSEDGGQRWSVLHGLPVGSVCLLLYAEGPVLIARDAARLYHSTDDGASWTWLHSRAWGPAPPRTLVPFPGGLLLSVQGLAGTIHASLDGGHTWRAFHDGLPPDAWSISLGGSATIMLAGISGHGVWRRAHVLPPCVAPAPLAFRLGPNEPNPFSDRTVIPYHLAEPGPVTLDVCDLYGKALATLLASYAAPGAHRIEFDGASLPAGLYLCRLTVGAASQVRPMLLLK